MEQGKKSKWGRQEIAVIVAAVVIVVLSVFVTLWVSGVFSASSAQQRGYKNITFTDALLTCEKQVRSTYSGKLLRLVTDDHSNRFDKSSNHYKIFFDAAISSNKSESGIGEFYINCEVSAHRGQVSDFAAYEQKESPTEAIRKDEGGLFGWPIN